jgi:hypothetical protein
MVTTNDLGDEPITIDLSMADAKLVGEWEEQAMRCPARAT